MRVINAEIARKYFLPEIKKYPHPTIDWYKTFLIQTDHITAKLIEAMAKGESTDQYSVIIEAREIARECINAIEAGTYDGEVAMQEIEIVEGIPLEDEEGPEWTL